jgi:hypothetical protein
MQVIPRKRHAKRYTLAAKTNGLWFVVFFQERTRMTATSGLSILVSLLGLLRLPQSAMEVKKASHNAAHQNA